MVQRCCVIGVREFGQVPLAELREPPRVVRVPAAQFGRRRDVAAPLVQAGVGLRQAARPEPIDQDAMAVARIARLVDPPDGDGGQEPTWMSSLVG